MILLDTSALYAVGVEEDLHHAEATRILGALRERSETLLVHAYVVGETFALLHRRMGIDAALQVSDGLASAEYLPVDRALHDRGVAWLRAHPSMRASLVDAVSFVVMRERGIANAFAFDPDFERAGYRLLRAPP